MTGWVRYLPLHHHTPFGRRFCLMRDRAEWRRVVILAYRRHRAWAVDWHQIHRCAVFGCHTQLRAQDRYCARCR